MAVTERSQCSATALLTQSRFSQWLSVRDMNATGLPPWDRNYSLRRCGFISCFRLTHTWEMSRFAATETGSIMSRTRVSRMKLTTTKRTPFTWLLNHFFIHTSLCDSGRRTRRRMVHVAISLIAKRCVWALTVNITFRIVWSDSLSLPVLSLLCAWARHLKTRTQRSQATRTSMLPASKTPVNQKNLSF